MTLLSVVQEAATLLTIPEPGEVFAETDPQVTQLRTILKVAGKSILRAHDWSALITAATFTCAATNAQTGHPPAAFDRMSDGVDMWNDTNDWPIKGPVSSREWTELIVRTVTTLPQYWRMINGVFNIYAPSDGDTIRYEYISENWILQAGTTPGNTFSADTDTFEFDETLLMLAIVWRWKQLKGFQWEDDLQTYNEALADEIKKDKGGLRIVSTERAPDVRPRRTWPGTVSPV